MFVSKSKDNATSRDTIKANIQLKPTVPFDSFDATSSLFSSNTLDPFSKFDMFYNNQGLSSSSPDSLFSIMADVESSGTRTPSPKNEVYTSTCLMRDDLYKTITDSPFLYHQYQRKLEPSVPVYNQYQYCFENAPFTSTYLKNYSDQQVSVESLKQQLKDSTDTVHQLEQQVNLTKIDNEKKQSTITALQASLANKDAELKDYYYKITAVNQLCMNQARKLNEKYAEISLYQTFIKSQGLDLPKMNSGDIESFEYKFESHNDNTAIPEHTNQLDYVYDRDTYSNEKRLAVDQRRALDKGVHTNWDLMVDRITRETDQHASIFMQQKLKSATPDQKLLIFQAALNQAYALMTNRFGNFLVQRLFELGSPEQIQALSNEMRGHILELTCNPFGCHVVQKAIEYVDEATKANMVSELLVRIPETIMHKHACHVWQKVFEIKWFQSPPPIMKQIHASLEGQWTQVALDETGSLVIQNIFENLTETDKRPIINNVLENAVSIAKGQWGNWVIQHIMEQAEKSSDREAAFDFVITEAVQLCMDQFASKVVEKALRIGGHKFITRFIQRISSTNLANKPRMALVDIASDQYGNYVVQWLINNVNENHKVNICRLIKRHMVSLRGSKYGQRVALLVEKVLRNHEATTYRD